MANLTGNIIVSVGISSGEKLSARNTTLVTMKNLLYINKQINIPTQGIFINKNLKDNQKAVGYIEDRKQKDVVITGNKLFSSFSFNVENNNSLYENANISDTFETVFFLDMEDKNIKNGVFTLNVLNYNKDKLKIKNNWYIQTTKKIDYTENRITKLSPITVKYYKDILYVKKENLAKSTGGTGGGSSIENFDGLELVFPLQKYTSVKIRFKMESIVEFFDLPEGIVYNNNTKEIQGIPIKAGNYISKVKVNNEKEYKILINIPYFTQTSLI